MTTDDDLYQDGMRVRREVLGDAHVDRALESATPVHRAVSGVHHPPCLGRGLDPRGARPSQPQHDHARGAPALGREQELALHIPAALGNGLSEQEIGEVLIHVAVYAGVPAANAAFALAQRVLAED